MNQKKIIRIVLYVALALVVLVLFHDWQQEHPDTQTSQQVSTQQNTNNDASSNPSVSAPIAATTNKAPNFDTTKTPADRIIHVRTDALDFSIDTLDGNIVEVKLPQYPVELHSTQPFILLNDDVQTHYSAQSGLNGFVNGPIQYSAAKASYIMEKGQKSLQVVLQATKNNLQISKVFTFHPNSYLVNVDYHVTNNGNTPVKGNMYMQINRTDIKPPRGKTFRLHVYYGFAMYTPEEHYETYSFSHLSKENVNQTAKGGWLAMTQHYFLGAWIPNPNETHRYYSSVSKNNIYSFGATNPTITIAPGKTVDFGGEFFSGPKITHILKSTAPYLNKTIDYGWLWPISIIIFWLMKNIHAVIGNWGWSIVLVTAIIKLIFWKPSSMSYKSMARMRSLQPKLNALKESCGADKQRFSKEMMGLYKKEKINPVGGCLPMLIQIPFFIALYWVLIASVQLRQAPFIFWIHDLAAKDPYYILPILMGVSMFVQQKLSPPPPDPTQAKMMMLLPIFITVVFLNFPAGLILYMLVNNIISVAQQWWITKNYHAPKPGSKKDWERRKKQIKKK